MSDLVKSIDDDDDPENFSEDSNSDHELQPSKKRAKTGKPNGGLDSAFQFSSFSDDIWGEKLALTKRKTIPKRTTLDEKIVKRIDNSEDIDDIKEESDEEVQEEKISSYESDSNDSISLQWANDNEKKKVKKKKKKAVKDDDIDFSDDELKEDEIKVRDKLRKAKQKRRIQKEEDEVEEDYEKIPDNQSFDTDLTFQQMNLSRPLLKAITSIGFVHATPIQAAAIPIALAGKDICGCAATGTGKTAAYMLPVLERLLYKPKSGMVTRVLCLVPTRELGVQVYRVTKQLSSFSNDIQVGLAVGGLDVASQETVLRQNPDIVIATPGRLIDHLGNTPSFTLDSIEILILDEADRMLDDWFAEQLKEIIKACSPRRQTLLFSATMTDSVKDLAAVSLRNPQKIFVDSNKQVAFNLRQQFVRIRNDADREAILCSLVVRTFHNKTMIFVPTKKAAHRIHILLGLLGVRVAELHGDLTQLQRLESLKRFQKGDFDVLIATDVAARGLDIPGVQSVVNFMMPPTIEQYIHRCGRTARAGRSGVAVSLVGEGDRKVMKAVAKSANLPVKSRIVPIDIIGKYRAKVSRFEKKIEEILAEEETERSIVRAEIQVNKALKLVQEKKGKRKKKKEEENKRVWFQSHNERQTEKSGLKVRLKSKDRKELEENEDEFKMRKLTEFQARNAKRKRRNRKDDDQPNGGTEAPSKKKKVKSHFDDELTNVKAARTFRHQPKVGRVKDKKPVMDNKKNGASMGKKKIPPKKFAKKGKRK